MVRAQNFQGNFTLFGYNETFKQFLKHFTKASTNKVLLKSGIRKDVAVSVNKE